MAVAKCDETLAASCGKAESKNDDCTQPGTCAALQAKLHSTLMSVIGNIR